MKYLSSFKNKSAILVALAAGTLLSMDAYAYDTAVKTREFSKKLASDDSIVISVKDIDLNKPRSFLDVLFSARVYLRIKVINSNTVSVGIDRRNRLLPDKTFWYNSLDRLVTKGNENLKHNAEVYISPHYMWIEFYAPGVEKSKREYLGAPFFFGPGIGLNRDFINQSALSLPHVRFFNSSELTKDIFDNYSPTEWNDPKANKHKSIRLGAGHSALKELHDFEFQ